MNCIFPLKRLLEFDEFATLNDVDILTKSFVDQVNVSSHSLRKRTTRKSIIIKRNTFINHSEIIQCLISILDDAIDQIHILSGGKKTASAIKEFNHTLQERVEHSLLFDPIYDNVTGDPYPVHFAREKLRKVLTDSSKIKEFLVLMRSELKEESSLKSVRTITNNIIRRKFEERNLLQDELKNFKTLRDFKQLSSNQNKEFQKEIDEIADNLIATTEKTETLLFENMLRAKYVKDWENARCEQNDLFCKRAEDELKNMTEKCVNEINTEMRVSNEEELFLLEEEQDFQYNIKYWSDKLVVETDQRIMQNHIIKERKEELVKNYDELVILYELHKKQLKFYLYIREKRAREKALKELRDKAATKIQAWWRGLMVRRKLGPFNPKKGKKGKKGKKDKKGKKKKK